MQKNAKNGTFFYKECKRMQRTEHSFIKNAKERKERKVPLKRTNAQPCLNCSVRLHNYTTSTVQNLKVFFNTVCGGMTETDLKRSDVCERSVAHLKNRASHVT